MNDHIPDVTKMIGDTPRMKAAQMTAMEHGTGDVWRVGCEIERELNAANARIKRLEEAGNELRWCASRIGTVASGEGSVIRRTEEAIQTWAKAKEAKL